MKNNWHQAWGKFRGVSLFAPTTRLKDFRVKRKLSIWERQEVARERKKNRIPVETTLQKILKLQKAQAINYLRELSEKKYRVIVPFQNRRKEFEQIKWKFYKRWRGATCGACKVTPFTLLHHIVMLKNGGTNDFDNLIGLCRE